MRTFVLCVVSALSIVSDNAQLHFAAPTQFAAGITQLQSGGSTVASADFNRDGYPDIASANVPSVAVVYGSPGGFTPPVQVPIGGCSYVDSITVIDIDNAAFPDMVVTCKSRTAYVLTGGPSGFSESTLTLPSAATFVASGDFNGDGVADLAFILDTKEIAVMVGANGGFGPVHITSTTVPAVYLTAGDFSHAGRQDLLVALDFSSNWSSEVIPFVFQSVGTGNFTKKQPLKTYFGYMFLVADANGDGNLDAIVANGTQISVCFGDGAGGFSPPIFLRSEGTANYVAVADLNGDGLPDVVSSNSVGSISIFYGKGHSEFQSSVNYEANLQPSWVGTGHFFENDVNDIVVLNLVENLGTSAAYSLIRDQGGRIASLKTTDVPSSSSPATLADMNGDGIPDAVLASSGVQIRAGSATGTFDRVIGGFAAGTNGLTSPVVADFNRDGLPDVAVAGFDFPGAIYIGLQQPDGTYIVVSTPLPWPASILYAGDLNGDQLPDLIVAQLNTNNRGPMQLWVLLNQGQGTFGAPQPVSSPTPAATVFGDFNGDGHVDIFLSDYYVGTPGQYFLAGRGDGTFAPAAAVAKLSNIYVLAAGDFNGDGKLDVAAVQDLSKLYMFTGRGDGTFKERLVDSTFPVPEGLVAADFNGDGRTDLLSWGFGNDLTLYMGLGNGDFVIPSGSYFCVSSLACNPSAVDMNGDGLLDIVSDDPQGGILSTLIHK